jgi:hypothetical protein
MDARGGFDEYILSTGYDKCCSTNIQATLLKKRIMELYKSSPPSTATNGNERHGFGLVESLRGMGLLEPVGDEEGNEGFVEVGNKSRKETVREEIEKMAGFKYGSEYAS